MKQVIPNSGTFCSTLSLPLQGNYSFTVFARIVGNLFTAPWRLSWCYLLHNVKIGLKKISDNKIKCYLCCYTSRKNKMNRKMNRAFYMLLFTFSLYGCNVKMSQKVNETLYQAENCMEEFPDSALSLLQHISHPEDLKGKAQADYALFYSQACDKNRISITTVP